MSEQRHDAPEAEADDMPERAPEHEASPALTPEEMALAEAKGTRIVEALLFAASSALDEATLAGQLPGGSDVPAIIARLAQDYRERGVNLVRVAEGWAFRTAPDLAPFLRVYRTETRRLSRAALETLATIAYHQPVTRAEIEEIRGVVTSKGTLDHLLEAGWIAPKGRREAPGRPVNWVTTQTFLDHFGLSALQDLPGVDELKAAGLLDIGAIAVRYGEGAEDEAGDEGESEEEPPDEGEGGGALGMDETAVPHPRPSD